MRKIQFRAWIKSGFDKDVKPFMADVYSIDFEDDTIKTEDEFWNFSDIVLMQYTGLKDKNGKEIYEGDLVAYDESVMSDMNEDKPNYIGKRVVNDFQYADGKKGTRMYGREIKSVEWINDSCGFEPFSDSKDNCGHCGGGTKPNRVEVIGNIYENPDLIN